MLAVAAAGRTLALAASMLLLVSSFLGERAIAQGGGGPTAWISGSLVKVHADAAAGTQQALQLSSARNEFESFQVHVRTGGSAVNLDVTVSDFVNVQDAGLVIAAATNVLVHREAYLDITTPSDTGGSLGRTPDPLVPTRDPYFNEVRNAFPYSVPANSVQSAWVDVLVPATATPGYYAATVSVLDGSTVLKSLTVTLKVWAFTLPSTATLKSHFGMSWNGMCYQAYTYAFGLSGSGYDQCGSYPGSAGNPDAGLHLNHVSQARFFLDHRISTDAPYVMADTTSFDSYYGPLLDGTAATQLSGARLTSLRYTPPGYRIVASEVQDWIAHFASKGWLMTLFNYTCDEPRASGGDSGNAPCDTFEEAKDLASAVHSASSSMRTLVTANIANASTLPLPGDNLLANLDIIVPVVNDMDPDSGGGNQRASYDAWLSGDPARQLWWYQSCSSHGRCVNDPPAVAATWPSYMIDATPVRNRVFQWLAFINRIGGELYYQSDYCWFSHPECQGLDPWTSVFAFGGNGDGTLYYPGRPTTTNGTTAIGGSTPIPIASIRLKHIRDGMEDYEYLAALSLAGDDAFARATAAGFITDAHTYSNDPQAMTDSREALGNRLHQLASGAAPTTVGISATSNPSVIGQSVTFTATVTSGAGTPSGTVTFIDGATSLGTVVLSGGSAGLSVTTLGVGEHSISAVYNGEASYAVSASPALIQTVNQGATTIAVGSAANPSTFGQSVTLTATVLVTAPAAGTPTGSVTLMDGAVTLGTGTLSAGIATLSTAALGGGGHTITAVYGGDASFAGSASPGASHTVNKAASTASLASAPNPTTAGQTVTLTATVASGAGTPTGTVSFMDGAASLGTRTLVGGSAGLTTSGLSIGSHTLTAVYGGDANFTTVTSPGVAQTVNAGALQVAPEAPIAAMTSLDGLIEPSALHYSISTAAGSAAFTVEGVPSWLQASPAAGTATTSPTVVAFTINPDAGTLPVGTYSNTVTFSANSGAGSRTREATLTVRRCISRLGDLNGNARGDVVYRRSDGALSVLFMDGLQVQAFQSIGQVGTEWTLVGIGDFNGDGRSDLLMRRTDGTMAIYLMNGAGVQAAQLIGNIGNEWKSVGVGDFNGDGRADFLMRRTDGLMAVYLMNGFQFVAAQVLGHIGTEWTIVGIADLDGNGRADVVTRRGDGTFAAYFFNASGLQVESAAIVGQVGTEWRTVGLGEFNGDGKADLLLRRTDGLVAMYLMNAAQVTAAQIIGSVGTELSLAGVGDLNADGKADLLFRRADGLLTAYLMDGFQVTSAAIAGTVAPEWDSCYGQGG